MIKKVKIEEIRRFQKIAGLLKEVDIDLSTTPRFNQGPNLSDKDFLNFVWDSIKDDWIEHKFSTMDPASRRGAVEQFLNSIPYSFLRDYWDDYIERKRRGIEENDIDLSNTPEFFSEPDMWDEGFRSFAWDIVGDYYEELYGTIDLDDIDDIIGQYLMNLPYDKLKALWGDYTKHKRTGLKESSIDLSDTPEFRSLGRSKIQREFQKAGVNVKRPIFVYSAYRLIGSYGMEKRSVGEYIDDILNTIDDLESDPDYGDSYGDVELEIVSNPDNIDPFDFFVEDDPKDIKLKVLIQGAVDDLIFQK